MSPYQNRHIHFPTGHTWRHTTIHCIVYLISLTEARPEPHSQIFAAPFVFKDNRTRLSSLSFLSSSKFLSCSAWVLLPPPFFFRRHRPVSPSKRHLFPTFIFQPLLIAVVTASYCHILLRGPAISSVALRL